MLIRTFSISICLSIVIAVVFDSSTVHGAEAVDKPAAEVKAKTEKVKVRNITLDVPTAWKKENPSSRLRLAQYRIPAVEGDQEDAELSVFSFGASDAAANVQRWISQFKPEGRTVAIWTGQAATGKYVIVELSGTQQKPGTRFLGVILPVPNKGTYYLKLVGPDKTVSKQRNLLRQTFGGDVKIEKKATLDSL